VESGHAPFLLKPVRPGNALCRTVTSEAQGILCTSFGRYGLYKPCSLAKIFLGFGDFTLFWRLEMRRLIGAAAMAGLGLAGCLACCLIWAGPAGAEVVIAIDKSIQRMSVTVDGKERHLWKVSTGTGGGPKAGTYSPQRLEKSWFSRKYNMSPMPHAIFFDEGYAIHGTIYVSRLGQRASHGCVRLHPKDAAALFDIVRAQRKGATTIVVTNGGWPAIAKKPAPEAPTKVSAPVAGAPAASPPKLSAAGPVTIPVSVVQPQPASSRTLLGVHDDSAPVTTGTVFMRPAEPPSLASASSAPAAPASALKAPHSEFQE
jgi:hypothetical protein